MTELTSIRSVHCIGIGGIGVSALARFFLARNIRVSGCDAGGNAEIPGATVHVGHAPEHLDAHPEQGRGASPEQSRGDRPFDSAQGRSLDSARDRPDLVVHSPAIASDHPELCYAQSLGIPTLDYPSALGYVGKHFRTVAVSGTHGKSTTTALLGHLLIEAGCDPTVIVGAKVPIAGFDHNFRAGNGKLFIVEACEYKRGMLKIHPHDAIITNIEADHLDYYRDLSDVQSAFREYMESISDHGVLIVPEENQAIRDMTHHARAAIGTFGCSTQADVQAAAITCDDGGSAFDCIVDGKNLGRLSSPLPGMYNVMNILAATGMALRLGASFSDIQKAVSRFTGIGRRFETVGRWRNMDIISDYAHHPTALSFATEAAMSRYRDGRVLVVFQPHQTDRTMTLREEFTKVFSRIPDLLVSEIYQVKGREDTRPFSVREIVDAANILRSGPLGFARGRAPIRYAGGLQEIKHLLAKDTNPYAAVVFIGAGDIDRVARELVP